MVSALGVDIRRLFMIVFGFGTMLAGFAGIMIAPILSVEPGMGDTILILAFVVIVIGGIGSIRGAFLAALLIGLVDTLGRSFAVDILRLFMAPSPARTVGPAIASMLIYLLMAVVLYLRPDRPVPREGALTDGGRCPPSAGRTPRAVRRQCPADRDLSLFALVPLFAAFKAEGLCAEPRDARDDLCDRGARARSADRLRRAGLVRARGFIGLGAYAVGILGAHGINDALISLPRRARRLGAVRFATGIVCLRTKGVYFIMITLAFGQMAYFTASSLAPYGGDDGLTIRMRSTLRGFPDLRQRPRALLHLPARPARRLPAVPLAGRLALRPGLSRRARERAAHRHHRLRGLSLPARRLCDRRRARRPAGFLLGNATDFVSPAYMSWQRSGELLIMVIFGGIGTLNGAIIGAAAFLLIEEWLSGITEHWKVIFGPLLVLVAVFAPGGLLGVVARLRRIVPWLNRCCASRTFAKNFGGCASPTM